MLRSPLGSPTGTMLRIVLAFVLMHAVTAQYYTYSSEVKIPFRQISAPDPPPTGPCDPQYVCKPGYVAEQCCYRYRNTCFSCSHYDECAEKTQNRACITDCVMTPWTSWGACSWWCGNDATQNRTRSVAVPEKNGGLCPEVNQTFESRLCIGQPRCPDPCVVSEWSDWGACNGTCGTTWQQRTRSIVFPGADGAAPCPPLVDLGVCSLPPCPIDCNVSAWTSWTSCTATCGGGTRTSTRTIVTQPANNGAACPALSRTDTCNTQPCACNRIRQDWHEIAPSQRRNFPPLGSVLAANRWFRGMDETYGTLVTSTDFGDNAGWRAVLERDFHGPIHNFVGGNMAGFLSSCDPLFWLLHSNVDRLWAMWQDCHGYDT
eukprot:Colp12_sorted_trinity150504_noHs@19551